MTEARFGVADATALPDDQRPTLVVSTDAADAFLTMVKSTIR